jgi:hypothetical protein
MQTLDLHGIRYHQVELMVEEFILSNELPLRIIVGNSICMEKIVETILCKYNFVHSPENYYNLGSWIIIENT